MSDARESAETRLFRERRSATPPEVANELGISPQQVKKLCRSHGLAMPSVTMPGEQPRYRIGVATFRALWRHCTGDENET